MDVWWLSLWLGYLLARFSTDSKKAGGSQFDSIYVCLCYDYPDICEPVSMTLCASVVVALKVEENILNISKGVILGNEPGFIGLHPICSLPNCNKT